jgi:Tfp pilus assembly protein PilE
VDLITTPHSNVSSLLRFTKSVARFLITRDESRRRKNYLPMLMSKTFSLALTILVFINAIAFGSAQAIASEIQSNDSAARTPVETVREFYKALREKRFREAFAMSIYNPAINGLSDAEFAALRVEFKNLNDQEFAARRPKFQKLTPEEFEELRPDFERLAANIPTDLIISGEQISSNTATVFVQIKDADAKLAPAEPIMLFRERNMWIIGERENAHLVKQDGKDFFFNLRIKTHQDEARAMLQRINLAEIAYAAQHTKMFADLPTLIAAGLLPKDVEATESTGYSFKLTLAADKRAFTVSATPARYNRTGRVSFFMDASGIKTLDTGGKMFDPSSGKKP